MARVGGEARRVEARIADIVGRLDLWGIIGAAALFTLGPVSYTHLTLPTIYSV